jgi:hypothetical protein
MVAVWSAFKPPLMATMIPWRKVRIGLVRSCGLEALINSAEIQNEMFTSSPEGFSEETGRMRSFILRQLFGRSFRDNFPARLTGFGS